MTPILLEGPAAEPVSLDEARAWLKLDTSAEDELVSALITSARLIVEATTRRILLTQTWRLVRDAWPAARVISLPLVPFQNLLAVRVQVAGGETQDVLPGLVTCDATPEQPRLSFAAALPVPATPFGGIEIDLRCGYGDRAQDVPEPLRHATRLLIGRWFDQRGDVAGDAALMPQDIAVLLAPFRRMRLA